MGKQQKQKSKNKQKKEAAVFKVAGVRKPKTKFVTTNLKKLKTHKQRAKTEELNEKFNKLQKSLTSAEIVTKAAGKSVKKSRTPGQQEPDMNKAVEDFSRL